MFYGKWFRYLLGVRPYDLCLNQDPCPVCLLDVTPVNGKGHIPTFSKLTGYSVLQHGIHAGCLDLWKEACLNNALRQHVLPAEAWLFRPSKIGILPN